MKFFDNARKSLTALVAAAAVATVSYTPSAGANNGEVAMERERVFGLYSSTILPLVERKLPNALTFGNDGVLYLGEKSGNVVNTLQDMPGMGTVNSLEGVYYWLRVCTKNPDGNYNVQLISPLLKRSVMGVDYVADDIRKSRQIEITDRNSDYPFSSDNRGPLKCISFDDRSSKVFTENKYDTICGMTAKHLRGCLQLSQGKDPYSFLRTNFFRVEIGPDGKLRLSYIHEFAVFSENSLPYKNPNHFDIMELRLPPPKIAVAIKEAPKAKDAQKPSVNVKVEEKPKTEAVLQKPGQEIVLEKKAPDEFNLWKGKPRHSTLVDLLRNTDLRDSKDSQAIRELANEYLSISKPTVYLSMIIESGIPIRIKDINGRVSESRFYSLGANMPTTFGIPYDKVKDLFFNQQIIDGIVRGTEGRFKPSLEVKDWVEVAADFAKTFLIRMGYLTLSNKELKDKMNLPEELKTPSIAGLFDGKLEEKNPEGRQFFVRLSGF